jgi:hypothetical protein
MGEPVKSRYSTVLAWNRDYGLPSENEGSRLAFNIAAALARIASFRQRLDERKRLVP